MKNKILRYLSNIIDFVKLQDRKLEKHVLQSIKYHFRIKCSHSKCIDCLFYNVKFCVWHRLYDKPYNTCQHFTCKKHNPKLKRSDFDLGSQWI